MAPDSIAGDAAYLVIEPITPMRRMRCGCSARTARGHAAEQRDELASSYVEHGLPSGTRRASLPQAENAPVAPGGPWGRPESF
jgi:hypothetical protein